MNAKSFVTLNSKIPLGNISSPSDTGSGVKSGSIFNFFSFTLASYSFVPSLHASRQWLIAVKWPLWATVKAVAGLVPEAEGAVVSADKIRAPIQERLPRRW